jgi:hypothetical protein
MSRVSKFLQWFFWVAFASFLTASIAHVTYFFRAYEPQNDGQDMLWWVVSFSIALSIDVTIFLLSVTVANLHRSKRGGSLIASVWVFIIGLAILSFYVNYKYAQHFTDIGMISPTTLVIPWVGTIGDINPFIASMFQILAICYTWIADKIVSDEKPLTAQELKVQADELENLAVEQKRIAAIKRGRSEDKTEGATSTLNSWIKAGKRVAKEAFRHEHNPDIQPGLLPTSNEQGDVNETGIHPTLNPEVSQPAPGLLPTSDEQNEGKTETNLDGLNPDIHPVDFPSNEQETGGLTAITGYDVIASWLASDRKSATIEDISRAVNLSVKVLKRRVAKGVLKTAPRNPDLILLASVLDLLKSEQSESIPEVLPVVKIHQNGHQKEGITGEMEVLNVG